jgi:hypothetical protein
MYGVILNIEEDYKDVSIASLNILNHGDYPESSIHRCNEVLDVIELVLSRLGLEISEYDREEELEPLNYTQYNVGSQFWLAFNLNGVIFLRNTSENATLFLPVSKDVYVHDNIAALINTVLK